MILRNFFVKEEFVNYFRVIGVDFWKKIFLKKVEI